jgi:hypothetical protein
MYCLRWLVSIAAPPVQIARNILKLHDIAHYSPYWDETPRHAGCPVLGKNAKGATTVTSENKRLLILIAGPYRSGTDDDPQKMADNLQRLEEASWPIFTRGHIPMIGEWVALPIWRIAGGQSVGDELYDRILHPTASRLIERCDAVLRLPGASKGADDDVRLATERGLPVYFQVDEIPLYEG